MEEIYPVEITRWCPSVTDNFLIIHGITRDGDKTSRQVLKRISSYIFLDNNGVACLLSGPLGTNRQLPFEEQMRFSEGIPENWRSVCRLAWNKILTIRSREYNTESNFSEADGLTLSTSCRTQSKLLPKSLLNTTDFGQITKDGHGVSLKEKRKYKYDTEYLKRKYKPRDFSSVSSDEISDEKNEENISKNLFAENLNSNDSLSSSVSIPSILNCIDFNTIQPDKKTPTTNNQQGAKVETSQFVQPNSNASNRNIINIKSSSDSGSVTSILDCFDNTKFQSISFHPNRENLIESFLSSNRIQSNKKTTTTHNQQRAKFETSKVVQPASKNNRKIRKFESLEEKTDNHKSIEIQDSGTHDENLSWSDLFPISKNARSIKKIETPDDQQRTKAKTNKVVQLTSNTIENKIMNNDSLKNNEQENNCQIFEEINPVVIVSNNPKEIMSVSKRGRIRCSSLPYWQGTRLYTSKHEVKVLHPKVSLENVKKSRKSTGIKRRQSLIDKKHFENEIDNSHCAKCDNSTDNTSNNSIIEQMFVESQETFNSHLNTFSVKRKRASKSKDSNESSDNESSLRSVSSDSVSNIKKSGSLKKHIKKRDAKEPSKSSTSNTSNSTVTKKKKSPVRRKGRNRKKNSKQEIATEMQSNTIFESSVSTKKSDSRNFTEGNTSHDKSFQEIFEESFSSNKNNSLNLEEQQPSEGTRRSKGRTDTTVISIAEYNQKNAIAASKARHFVNSRRSKF